MPKVLVNRPNRSRPRLLGPTDVARMYCFLVEKESYPREIIDAAIDEQCADEEKKKKAQRAAEAAQAQIEGGDLTVDQLDQLYKARDQFRKVEEFIEQEQRETKRLLKIIDVIAALSPLLRRVPIFAPVAIGARRIRSSVAAREAQLNVIKASNDEAFNILAKSVDDWDHNKVILINALEELFARRAA